MGQLRRCMGATAPTLQTRKAMKTTQPNSFWLRSRFSPSPLAFAACIAFLASACASNPVSISTKTDKDISANGPTVVDARANPDTFELNRDLGARTAEVMASVQDFDSKVKSVTLSFIHVPLEIPMSHVVGNVWRTELSDAQLRKLAVEGKTMKYEAYVVAHDGGGKVSASPKEVTITVKAPDLSANG